MSKKVAEVEESLDCEKVWLRAKDVCYAINRLEKSHIFLPEAIIPLVRHFQTCSFCKAEFAYMYKRCSFVLQECQHKLGFVSAKGCVHIVKKKIEGAD